MTGKERLIELLKLLYAATDEDHQLSTAEIVANFAEKDVPTDRSTVKADIDVLNKCGIEILATRGTQTRYYFSDRQFELAELKLLVDAVESSKFITARKSGILVKKLMTLAGDNSAKELERHLYTAGRIKPENESIFYTVDIIHRAINSGMQIAFIYYEYTTDKTLVPKHDCEPYIFSPYAMLYNEDKYYVLGYSEHHGKIITFRVDRMKAPNILDKCIVTRPENFDPVNYTVNIFSMYDGESCEVSLLCRNELMKYVIDRFGEAVRTEITNEEHFTVTTEVSVSQTFFAWVFQFAGGIRITGPTAVKEQYRQMLEKAQN